MIWQNSLQYDNSCNATALSCGIEVRVSVLSFDRIGCHETFLEHDFSSYDRTDGSETLNPIALRKDKIVVARYLYNLSAFT